ncbi:rhomboid family intramembrane serine protease [Phytopseudomonas dryadis]|uniref:Peptidase S54 rhomboid domain-containing protein n=1 Tax=Phytopseudomonas dryadis TaxID=2487520 RepID=A0A4Q9QW42_9GAMM|nr:rhomboid family intramembrane serine protease [Pseudomonas dryadis]TBU88319.1 hypothetical protein DNK44_18825 [Pseudomonas dryadis]
MEPTGQHRLRLPWLTLCLIIANLGAYWWMADTLGHFGPYDETELMLLGANVASLSATGDYARLFTSMFLHGSLLHLGQNMFALLLIGTTLESLLARWQWLALYLLGGLFASFASATLNFDREQVSLFGQVTQIIYISVGASGAIMSLAGAELGVALGLKLWAMNEGGETRQPDKLLRSALLMPILVLVYGLLDGGTDNVAHVAGFLFGLLAVAPVAAAYVISAWPPRVAVGLGVLLVLGLSGLQLFGRVASHPDSEGLRQLALWEVEETRRLSDLHQRVAQERQASLSPATPEQAKGLVIPVPFVGRMVPSSDPQRVFLLKNYNQAQIIEYDLARNAPVRTLIDHPYAGNDLWGCPVEQCFGVGVSDLQLDEANGKGYVSSLVKGALSRIDLASGRIDWTTVTGKFPSRLLLREGRLYSLDRVDNSLVILDAESGKQLAKVQLPGEGDNRYRWPQGETLQFSSQGDALYLLPAERQPLRLDLASQELTPVGDEGARQMGRDGQGRLWLLYEDGVFYPELDARRERVFFRMDRHVSPRYVNTTFIDRDGRQPLILHLESNFVLASSGRTGQLLRLYPLAHPEREQLYLQALDGGRFYVSGRQATQLLDIDTALPAAGAGDAYQAQLEEQPQWKRQFKRQEPPRPASGWGW